MSVDFFGMIYTRNQSEIHAPEGAAIDRDYVRDFAVAHEEAGFDRILYPLYSSSPDGFLTLAYAASVTKRIHFLLAHRPGFVAPTLAARKLATLDHFTGGRVAVHIISGGDDADQRRDGDFLSHDERYARTDEYLDILRRIWTSDTPIDHHGRHYQFEGAWSEVKPLQKPHLPIFFGGASDAAIQVAGKHADAYALWGENLAQTRDTIARVRAEAAKHGRDIRFSVSFRPILADTEAAAWERADHILDQTRRLRAEQGLGQGSPLQSEGARRLLAAAGNGSRADKRLWNAIAQETGGRANTTALVGTPEQVADALLDYYDLGVTTFLIRGFEPLEDAIDYGRKLIPLTRERVAARDAQTLRKAG